MKKNLLIGVLRVDFGNGKDERARKRQTALADDDFRIRHGDRELNGFSALLGDEQRSRPVGRQMARCLGAGEQVEHLLASEFHRQPPKHHSFMCSIGISFPVQSLNAAAPWNNIIPRPFIVLHPTSFAIERIFVSSGE